MNAAPLELSHNLLQTIDSLFVKNNIAKYFKDFFLIVCFVLFLPILYLSFWIFALIVCFIIHKSYSQKINFTNAEEYRQSRIAYDKALPISLENEVIFSRLKEVNKILYFILYPFKIMYLPFEWYCRDVKKEFEKLDKPTKEGDIFEIITEQEMWQERPSAYEYRI